MGGQQYAFASSLTAAILREAIVEALEGRKRDTVSVCKAGPAGVLVFDPEGPVFLIRVTEIGG